MTNSREFFKPIADLPYMTLAVADIEEGTLPPGVPEKMRRVASHSRREVKTKADFYLILKHHGIVTVSPRVPTCVQSRMADVHVDGQHWRLSVELLCENSQYFERLWNGNMAEGQAESKVADLSEWMEIDGNSFAEFVRWLEFDPTRAYRVGGHLTDVTSRRKHAIRTIMAAGLLVCPKLEFLALAELIDCYKAAYPGWSLVKHVFTNFNIDSAIQQFFVRKVWQGTQAGINSWGQNTDPHYSWDEWKEMMMMPDFSKTWYKFHSEGEEGCGGLDLNAIDYVLGAADSV